MAQIITDYRLQITMYKLLQITDTTHTH